MLVFSIYQKNTQPVKLHAKRAATTVINNSLSVQGTLKPIRKSRISSYETGIIRKTFVRPGDQVKVGDPLVLIEPMPHAADGIAEIASAYIETSATGNMQSGVVLYADIAGVVSDCSSEGAIVYPAQTAVSIDDFSTALIAIEVPELYASGLEIGQAVSAVPVSNQLVKLTGTLTGIDSQIIEKKNILSQSSERIVNCTITLKETDHLKSGTSLDVSIITDSVKNAVIVPYAAVRQIEGNEFIYVVSENGIEKRKVETGYYLPSEIQVKTGVSKGEWVLVDETVEQSFPNGYVVVPA